MKLDALFCSCIFTLIWSCSQGGLTNKLHHYETLHHSQFEHQIHRRSTRTQTATHKDLKFKTLGRDFHISLQSEYGLLSSDFQAVSVDSEGHETPIAIDQEEFYSGVLYGEPDSKVFAYFEDEALSASIQTPQEIYYIEPSWRHLPNSSNYSMIAYKGSDVKKQFDKEHPDHHGGQFCSFVREGWNKSEEDSYIDQQKSEHERDKRQAYRPLKTRCPLLLTADYLFFENMGQKSKKKTTHYLIALIDRVNNIYKNTTFDTGYDDFGFEIKKVVVHNSYNTPAFGKKHYNQEKLGGWDTRELLELYSRDSTYGAYCLAHLFTFQKFSGGVLGLAYIASQRSGTVGGICTAAYYKGGHNLYLNTGWTTAKNRDDERILTQEADLVTAHEFGHNWGSEHDPDTDECSPSSFDGGKFIMYTYSVSGFEANNKLFSPCSKNSIASVLKAKSSACFVEPSRSYCGNYRKEAGEECDAGLEGKDGLDQCCDHNCRLRDKAMCSPVNDRCCTDECRVAQPGVVCDKRFQINLACEQDAVCDGLSINCPPAKKKNDNSSCIDRGKCKDGRCLPFCETMGKISCMCDDPPTLSCKWCCRDDLQSKCKPIPHPDKLEQILDLANLNVNDMLNLPEGVPCLQGYCVNGLCKKQKETLTQRIFRILEEISVDAVIKFMRDNIVGTIIVLSLLLWIPLSCVVWRIDVNRAKEAEELAEWKSRENIKIVHDKDKDRIRKSSKTRRRPPAGSVVRTDDFIKQGTFV